MCSAALPFKCMANSTSCVADPSTDCCATGQSYCPHSRTCVTSQDQCCSLDPQTPFYCKASSTCVKDQFECCSNVVSGGKALSACPNGGKCASFTSANVFNYCFLYQTDCPDENFPHMCSYTGTCVKSPEHCASPRVCPPVYD